MMQKRKILMTCEVCNQEFEHGPRYTGHVLHLYGNASCCGPCWDGNWDGWNIHAEESLVKLCQRKGISLP